MHDYQRIADRVAADILSGRLKPGQRLPPQRSFARRRGIAASTAGRVYAELVRRGLVVAPLEALEQALRTLASLAHDTTPQGTTVLPP